MPKSIVNSVSSNGHLVDQIQSGRILMYLMNTKKNHFIPHLKKRHFFFRWYKSHLTQQVSQLCDDHGIVLISHCKHIMQPSDVAVFKALKSWWTTVFRDWKFEIFPKEVTRYTISRILKFIFYQYAKTTSIKNGFRKCGLYPWNKTKVEYSNCKSWKESNYIS